MDPAEYLFEGFIRLWKTFRGTSAHARTGAAVLDAHRGRMELVATALMGRHIEVMPADGGGGFDGRVVLLPKQVSSFDGIGDNVSLYAYRVAYAASALECGSVEVSDGSSGSSIASLLAVPRTLEHMHRVYPGTLRLTRNLLGHLFRTHSQRKPKTMSPIESLWWIVADHVSAGEIPGPHSELNRSPHRGWLEKAWSLSGEPLEDIRSEAERLSRAAAGHRSHDRKVLPVSLDLWGGLWGAGAGDAGAQSDETVAANPEPRSKTRVVELQRTLRIQRRRSTKREDRPLFHAFEKLETAEDYRGQRSTPDPVGDIRTMDDAVSDLELGVVIKTDEQPSNLARADVVDAGIEADGSAEEAVAESQYAYPEWNHRSRSYRDDWVSVVERRHPKQAMPSPVSDFAVKHRRREVEQIRNHLLRTLHRRRVRKRELDGDQIDIGAMVERHAELRAGRSPSDRLYLGTQRVLRDISVLILLDASYSTDAWIEGRRVLDVELQSVLILSRAFEGLIDDEVAVASFRSRTRHGVEFGVLKDFSDPWSRLRQTASSIAPDGYTRIGAAIRHSTFKLSDTKARHKLLLVVSDGKPTDFDRYEGDYGIEDVAVAVREARAQGVVCYGLNIEEHSKARLSRMLGPGRYRTLTSCSALPNAMADVFISMLDR